MRAIEYARNFVIHRQQRLVGLSDQAMYSVATLLQTFSYARILDSNDFAIFAMVQGSYLIGNGIQRSAAILPMIMTSGEREDSAWHKFDVLLRVVISLALFAMFAVCRAVSFKEAISYSFLLAAFCTFPLLSYEFHRRILFIRQNGRQIVIASGLYLLLTLVTIAVVGLTVQTVEVAAAGLFISAAIAWAAAAFGSRRVGPGQIRIRDHLGLIGWNLLSFVPYSLYNSGMVLVAGVLTNTKIVALFAASRIFIAPVQTLIQAIDSVDKPRARREFARGGTPALRASLRSTRKTLLLGGGLYLVVIFCGAGLVSSYVMDGAFDGMEDAIRVWCFVALLMLLGQPLETGLLVLGRSNVIFWTRSLAALLTIGVMVLTLPITDALAPLFGLSGGWAAGAGLAWIALAGVMRKQGRSDERSKSSHPA